LELITLDNFKTWLAEATATPGQQRNLAPAIGVAAPNGADQ